MENTNVNVSLFGPSFTVKATPSPICYEPLPIPVPSPENTGASTLTGPETMTKQDIEEYVKQARIQREKYEQEQGFLFSERRKMAMFD